MSLVWMFLTAVGLALAVFYSPSSSVQEGGGDTRFWPSICRSDSCIR